jgi:N-acetyl-alpha-D-glucosaminyl L-malate synthase BshA
MKIGINCYPTFGGSGAVATELGIELSKMGHCIHFISYGLPFRLNRFYRNIIFHEVEVMNYPLFKYPPYTLSLSVKMSEIIESEKLDLLHVHYAMPHATSAYLAKKIAGKNKVKFITTLHGTDITLVGKHHSFFEITKFSIERSDGITCVSEYLKKLTRKTFNIKNKMEVIPNFVDTEEYKRDESYKDKSKPEESGSLDSSFLDKGDCVLCHISNFRPVKRVQNIIKAFSSISREVSSKLILVGDGPELHNCRILAEKLGLIDKIYFTGLQENIIPVLNLSDLYLLPSESESFGLSALEAMSCSVPVVGTKTGGLCEVVEDGRSGFLINPDSVDEIVESSLKILGERKTWEKMSMEARKRALLFDSRVIVPKYLDYYKKIL